MNVNVGNVGVDGVADDDDYDDNYCFDCDF
jgi:hypothetical protein